MLRLRTKMLILALALLMGIEPIPSSTSNLPISTAKISTIPTATQLSPTSTPTIDCNYFPYVFITEGIFETSNDNPGVFTNFIALDYLNVKIPPQGWLIIGWDQHREFRFATINNEMSEATIPEVSSLLIEAYTLTKALTVPLAYTTSNLRIKPLLLKKLRLIAVTNANCEGQTVNPVLALGKILGDITLQQDSGVRLSINSEGKLSLPTQTP